MVVGRAAADASVPVALQLWTVRDDCGRDFAGTLGTVAGMGYAGVELVESLGHGGLDAAALREELAQLGREAVGNHVALDVLEEELERLVAFALELGCPYLVCAWAPEERRRDAAAYRQMRASLSAIGARCREAGLRLAYHHHDFELGDLGGVTGLELLCEADPQLLEVEADVYWLRVAGHDPADYLRRLGPRCRLVHLKDMRGDALAHDATLPPEGYAGFTTEVGNGVIDLHGVAAAAAHARWYIVEQDGEFARTPLESARTGLDNLRALSLA